MEHGGMVFPRQSWTAATPESQGAEGAGLAAALEYLSTALKDHGGIGTVFIVRNGYPPRVFDCDAFIA